jgi:hypothetical protein
MIGNGDCGEIGGIKIGRGNRRTNWVGWNPEPVWTTWRKENS